MEDVFISARLAVATSFSDTILLQNTKAMKSQSSHLPSWEKPHCWSSLEAPPDSCAMARNLSCYRVLRIWSNVACPPHDLWPWIDKRATWLHGYHPSSHAVQLELVRHCLSAGQAKYSADKARRDVEPWLPAIWSSTPASGLARTSLAPCSLFSPTCM
jgi:hypothetical protein